MRVPQAQCASFHHSEKRIRRPELVVEEAPPPPPPPLARHFRMKNAQSFQMRRVTAIKEDSGCEKIIRGVKGRGQSERGGGASPATVSIARIFPCSFIGFNK